MTGLEALADAIMQFEGWHPGTRSWRNRNPGNLRPYRQEQPDDGEGYRVFATMAEGWLALLADLQAKRNGSHNLGPQAALLQLLNVYAPAGDYNSPTAYAAFVAEHLTHALGRTITLKTTLEELIP